MNPSVSFYFDKANKWQEEITLLRNIVLDCGLGETLKWGTPCYMHNKNNIVLIHVFKEYCALLFFKGALLQDPNGILIQQTKNVQAARQARFTNVAQIATKAAELKACIYEAIAIEKAGLKVAYKKVEAADMPVEFNIKLTENEPLKTAFAALTPGRQRGYLLHFSAPKQAKTREARIEKSIPQILMGKGLND